MDKRFKFFAVGSVRLWPVLFIAMAFSVLSTRAQEKIDDRVMQQIRALQVEKASRSPIHRKLDSQFVFELKRSRGETIAAGVTELRADIKREADGRLLVDIKAVVTQGLLDRIVQGGGTVIHSSPKFGSIRAQVRLDQLEDLAALEEVKFIQRAAIARTNTGSVNSEGDATHLAAFARTNYGATGAGVKVGVISDDASALATSQSHGDLPNVTVLPAPGGTASSEGVAMLEIIHDLAPDAELYFATGLNGQASFAENILNLRSNGCDIIVDDLMYFDESPFQDGIIAQAVNTVTADGALYFSSAGNEGNLKNKSTGTWEGNFVNSGQTMAGFGGAIHSFGGGTNYNPVTVTGQGVDLFWADPLGASTNDYDLFLLNSVTTNVLYAADNPQTGTQDPYEFVNMYPSSGTRVVIVKFSGATRFLHLDTYRGGLGFTTTGATRGHSAATNAISVGAVNAMAVFPNPFFAASYNQVRPYSCDGPRRVFFQPDGTPITPGNFTSTGGTLRQKPDLCAADGISTSVYGYSPFNGSSAAAPHAAAIAALVRSAAPLLTTAQIRAVLTNAVLDIEAAGRDINSGAGILMADRALGSVLSKPVLMSNNVSFVSESVPNGAIDPGETVTVNIALTNVGYASTTNLVATLLDTDGVASASGPQTYGSIAAHGIATQSFSFVASGSCGDPRTATLQLQDGTMTPIPVTISFVLGRPINSPIVEDFERAVPPSLPTGWTTTTSGTGSPWRTTNGVPGTLNNSARVQGIAGTGESSLISPPFTVSQPYAQISFRQYVDGTGPQGNGILEISTNGGPFLDLLQIGGFFATNGPNFFTGGPTNHPLFGHFVWSMNFVGQVHPTVACLPPSTVGQTLRLRLRFVVFNGCTGFPICTNGGWFVDSFTCTDGSACTVTPSLTAANVSFNAAMFPLDTHEFNFALNGTLGSIYQVQYKTNLGDASWLDVDGPFMMTNSPIIIWSPPIEDNPQRFYRVKLSP